MRNCLQLNKAPSENKNETIWKLLRLRQTTDTGMNDAFGAAPGQKMGAEHASWRLRLS